jgi:hypothetical protein
MTDPCTVLGEFKASGVLFESNFLGPIYNIFFSGSYLLLASGVFIVDVM